VTVRELPLQEFDCPDCGRHVVRAVVLPGPLLCLLCVHLPGWFNDDAMRSIFDADGQLPASKP
jgi:hypothetical protein